jgi:hypothetical protein
MDFALAENGSPITDVAGSAFFLYARNRATGALKISSAAMSVISVPLAQLRYVPTTADMNTPGSYELEIRQVRPDTTVRHFPSDGYVSLEIEEVLA